jgi:hypothetical protein
MLPSRIRLTRDPLARFSGTIEAVFVSVLVEWCGRPNGTASASSAFAQDDPQWSVVLAVCDDAWTRADRTDRWFVESVTRLLVVVVDTGASEEGSATTTRRES